MTHKPLSGLKYFATTHRSINQPVNRFWDFVWFTQMNDSACDYLASCASQHRFSRQNKRSIEFNMFSKQNLSFEQEKKSTVGPTTRNLFTIRGMIDEMLCYRRCGKCGVFFSSNLCTMYWIRSRKIESHQQLLWNSMLWRPIQVSHFEYWLKY